MYEFFLILHIFSFISWFAVLFYLPRIFVYHAENNQNNGFISVAKIMEYKLAKYIGVPAMYLTVISGAGLIYATDFQYLTGSGWLHAKLLFVVMLIIYAIYLEKIRKKLETDEDNHSGKFFRILNEVPTILMIIIVSLVILKPF